MKFIAIVLCFVTMAFSQLSYFESGQTGGFLSAGGAFSDDVNGFVLSGGIVPAGRVLLQAAYMHSAYDGAGDISSNGLGLGADFAIIKQSDDIPLSLPLIFQFQYESISSPNFSEYGIEISGKTFIFGGGLETELVASSTVSFVPQVHILYYTTTATMSSSGYGSEDTKDDGAMLELGFNVIFKVSPTNKFGIDPGVTLGFDDQDPVFNISGTLAFGQ